MTSLRLSRNKIAVSALLVATAGFFIALAFLSSPDTGTASADGGGGECSSCHSGIRIYTVEATAPTEVASGATFTYSVTVTNYDGSDGNPHEINDIELRLEIAGENIALAPGENATKSMADMKNPGTGVISWELDAVSPGNATLRVFTEGTAHYDHEKDKNPDDYRYERDTGSSGIVVKDIALALSNYSFSLMEGQAEQLELTVFASENITDLRVWIPGSMADVLSVNSTHPDWTGSAGETDDTDGAGSADGTDETGGTDDADGIGTSDGMGGGIPGLNAGEDIQLRFYYSGMRAISDEVMLSWRDASGNLQTIGISFNAQEKDDGGGSSDFSYCDFSRVLGYVSAVALISLFISGCRSPKVKKCMNGLCGCAKNRLRLHCGVSYFALFTALLHGIIFIWRRDTLYLDDFDVILGDISVLAMALVALNGIYQRRIVKKYGFKAWHRFHTGVSVVALVTAIMHIMRLRSLF